MFSKPLSKLTVAVIMGGKSAEREVSLRSGLAVANALSAQSINVIKLDGIEKLLKCDLKSFDAVFNILHGEAGENGELAGFLSSVGIAYTGCGLKGAVLSWDKSVAKTIVQAHGIRTPNSQVIINIAQIKIHNPGPWIVKPTQEGSSVGLFYADNEIELKTCARKALKLVDSILIEDYIQGSECTVAIVKGKSLPVIRIKPGVDLYDYEAKYNSTQTEYFCPSGYDNKLEDALKQDALKAFKALHLKGWARIDFMVDKQGKHWFLEANTTPGMTQTSLVPKAANAIGWSFNQLVLNILSTAFTEVKND